MTEETLEIENTLAEWCEMPWMCAPYRLHNPKYCSATPYRDSPPMPALLAQIAKAGWKWAMDNLLVGPYETYALVNGHGATDLDPEVALKLATHAALEARNG